MESTIKVARGDANKEITLDAIAPPGSPVTWTVYSGASSGRVYFLTTDGNQVQRMTGTQVSVVYEATGDEGVNNRDQFVISATNVNGNDMVTFNVVPDDPPIIFGSENREIRIYTRSTVSAPLVLRANDDSVEDLQWTWSPGGGFPDDATVRLTTSLADGGSIASVTFSHESGSLSSGTFSVQVMDETGGRDEVLVTVSTTPNRSPTITEGDQLRRVIEGERKHTFCPS